MNHPYKTGRWLATRRTLTSGTIITSLPSRFRRNVRYLQAAAGAGLTSGRFVTLSGAGRLSVWLTAVSSRVNGHTSEAPADFGGAVLETWISERVGMVRKQLISWVIEL